ncbi:hypothetical protein EK904_009269, partial [Melospiza melodia maxima]
MLCCLFLSEIPQLCFTHIEISLLSESLLQAGSSKNVKGKLANANLMKESLIWGNSELWFAMERPSERILKVYLPLCYVFSGALTVGLVRQCQTIHGRDRTCIPPRLPPEWVTTLFFIIMGIISLTVTCGLLVASHWRREATKYARWIAFTGMILFCMAALIFPIGFYINEVGGQPYKLPNNTVVGSSYVLFVLSIFFT